MRIEDDSTQRAALTASLVSEAQSGTNLKAAKSALFGYAGIALVGTVVPVGLGAGAWLALAGWSLVPATKTITELIHDQPAAPPAISAQAQDRRASDRASDARPTPGQLQPEARPASKAKAVITNYTVFKTVSFQSGVVSGVIVTGWKFDDSNRTAPHHQYCYFEPSISGSVNNYIMIGEDGHALSKTKELRGVNLEAAASNCVWSSPKSASTTK
jgi:hypothetical protein